MKQVVLLLADGHGPFTVRVLWWSLCHNLQLHLHRRFDGQGYRMYGLLRVSELFQSGFRRFPDFYWFLGKTKMRFLAILLFITTACVGCYPEFDEVPKGRCTLKVRADGMVWINVTNMPVPELIRAIDRECTKTGCDYSIQIRLTGNWQGQVSVLEDKNADPFKPDSKWKTVSKMPRVTVNEERIFITNLLGIIKQHVPNMGVSYLGDGREILITAMPYSE